MPLSEGNFPAKTKREPTMTLARRYPCRVAAQFNLAASGNGAIAILFRVGRFCRAVPEKL